MVAKSTMPGNMKVVCVLQLRVLLVRTLAPKWETGEKEKRVEKQQRKSQENKIEEECDFGISSACKS